MAILQETPQINKNKLKTTYYLLGENQAIISEPHIFKTHPVCEMSPPWSGNLPHKQLQEKCENCICYLCKLQLYTNPPNLE